MDPNHYEFIMLFDEAILVALWLFFHYVFHCFERVMPDLFLSFFIPSCIKISRKKSLFFQARGAVIAVVLIMQN